MWQTLIQFRAVTVEDGVQKKKERRQNIEAYHLADVIVTAVSVCVFILQRCALYSDGVLPAFDGGGCGV